MTSATRGLMRAIHPSRRRFLAGSAAGLAAILATGRAPVFAQTAAKKLLFAHINPAPNRPR